MPRKSAKAPHISAKISTFFRICFAFCAARERAVIQYRTYVSAEINRVFKNDVTEEPVCQRGIGDFITEKKEFKYS